MIDSSIKVQSNWVGKRVKVKSLKTNLFYFGTITRDDAQEPFKTEIITDEEFIFDNSNCDFWIVD